MTVRTVPSDWTEKPPESRDTHMVEETDSSADIDLLLPGSWLIVKNDCAGD